MRNLNLHFSKPSHWSYARPHRHHCLVRKHSAERSAVDLELRRWAHWFNTKEMTANNFGSADSGGMERGTLTF